MPEPQTLPAMVRAKYPGVYDDIPDAELDTKVRSKYPGVYDDLPKPSMPESPVATQSATAQSSIGGPITSASGWALKLATNPDTWRRVLDAPNAPRVIQRAIGAGVRGISTAAGAAIGGVPGAVAGAAMSEGLTPTQQTIRGWLGRTATTAAAKAAPDADAVVNYIEAMGADAKNLGPAALEYAKKAGRAVLYDESGHAALVPAETVQHAVAAPVAQSGAPTLSLGGKLARALSMAGAVQSGLDLAQVAEPNRADIGFLGIGAHHDPIDPKDVPLINEGIAKVFDKMGRADLAKLWRGEK